ncbi:hypothetical protein [Streptomyces heilongjiangensis]|uniref:DEAD/DEAH box helicase n=1 Tax=Streptomyces heilongjiangensis TaxID=945052 RepID=A0ABW1BJ03_9ACTN|nr:hypothetical protein [Streptomyces heilongjiangensis]MDC2952235.1 hypothetical protein [Streptomyces heilongjiangensis]
MASINPPVTATADLHAERLRARDVERAKSGQGRPDGRQTWEIYGERALAGARADAAARKRAERSDRRARGEWVPGDEETDEAEGLDEEDVDDEYEETDEVEEDEAPVSTAELYARRERQRQRAERAANLAAQGGAVGAWLPHA